MENVKLFNLQQLKGHNLNMSMVMWLVIKHGHGIMTTNILKKFGEDPTKNCLT